MSQLPIGHSRPEAIVADMHWGNDQLSREPYADQLTRLIANTEGPYVIGLTSEWGSGKTFFLRAWQKKLQSYGVPCVYVNAWETDHVEDPLVAFMGCVEDQLKDETGTETDVLFNKLNKSIGTLLKNTPTVFAKGFLKYICKKADYTPDEIESELFETVGESCINTFIDSMKEKEAFTASLAQLAKNVTQKYEKSRIEKQKDEKFDPAAPEKFPLLIMVDELDRCRPDYAIALLERIKHLFSVPGVVFLLAVDATQLLMLTEHRFGLKKKASDNSEESKTVTDARMDYLNKFFDIFYRLPPPDLQEFVKYAINNYCDLKNHDHIKENNGESFLINVLISDKKLFEGKSLRSVLQLIEKFSIFLKYYNSDYNELFTAFYIIFKNNYTLYMHSTIFEKVLSDEDTELVENIQSLFSLGRKSTRLVNFDNHWNRLRQRFMELNGEKDSVISCLYAKCIITDLNKEDVRAHILRTNSPQATNFIRYFEMNICGQTLEDRVQRKLALLENFSSTPM